MTAQTEQPKQERQSVYMESLLGFKLDFWDYATFLGTIGLFLTLLLLFIRFLPVISIFEMRALVQKVEERSKA